ncbi:MAG: hypothetical protein ACK59G_06670 [Cyanobacteriota bacterium]|jgi:hypothetical protein
MAAPSQGLNPFLTDLEVMQPARIKPAAKLYDALIQQATESLDRSQFGAAEVGLSAQKPVDFTLLDHP